MAKSISINDIPEAQRGGLQKLLEAQGHSTSSTMSTQQFPSAPADTSDKPLNNPFRSSGKFAKNGTMVGGAGQDGPSPFAHNPRAVVPYKGGAVQPHASFSGRQPGAGNAAHAGIPYTKGFDWNPNSGTSEGTNPDQIRSARKNSMAMEHVPGKGSSGYGHGSLEHVPGMGSSGGHEPPPTERNTTVSANGGGGWVNHHYMGSGGVRNALQKGTDAFQRSRVFAGPNGVTQAIRYTIGAPPMTQRTRRMYQASAYENLNNDQFSGGREE
jgi:hypothetical protein